MDLNKLEQQINVIVESLQDVSQSEFIYQLLLAYDFPKSSITRLKKGDYNQSKNEAEILWKKNLFFKVEKQQDLHLIIDEAQKDEAILKHKPRFIIITDFKTLLAVDTKVGDSLDISLDKLSENYRFFQPWMGKEKSQIHSLNPADVKAAEKLAQLYDIIIQNNQIESDVERHGLNIFLSRLLFCFFAEDTGIFDDDQFTNAIDLDTHEDGSNCQEYLNALFKVLNVKKRSNEPAYLKAFPYVNGGLFEVDYPAPKLNAKARKLIINSGSLNWKQINPDIFGSMMQAVIHSDQRGSLGMHYTSVANIMKVIEPLFLNDLKQQLEKAEGNENKLTKLLGRLYHLRLFDPACGSGNFLIIAYKELCKVEIEIFEQLRQINPDKWNIAISGIRLTQFYGIELDDFAHETAKLSLWLAEHQMNLAFKSILGMAKPTLPLQEGGHIVCGNATRLNWEDVCPKGDGDEIYIMGNPPYKGARVQEISQKMDMKLVFQGEKGYNNLDYIACWFKKSACYIVGYKAEVAFVSTNSICQGMQVSLFWPSIFQMNVEISFAHKPFPWSNNAKNNATVICSIIGIRNNSVNDKYIYSSGVCSKVQNINAYLAASRTIFIRNRSKPLSDLPSIRFGNMPNDGGHLILNNNEYNELISNFPKSKKFIKFFLGASDFLRGQQRWCLWILDADLEEALKIPPIYERIGKVKLSRLSSKRSATQLLAKFPHKFGEIRNSDGQAILFPCISSERRQYIPVGIINSTYIASNKVYLIYDVKLYIFGILSSGMHMVWIRSVTGRLKNDFNYSSLGCYNTFPFPDISEAQKTILEDHVFKVLDEREQHSEKTMAELYDPDKMPEGLRQAHHEMDLAVEQCYRKKPFKSDEERLEYLFRLYEEMINLEKQQ